MPKGILWRENGVVGDKGCQEESCGILELVVVVVVWPTEGVISCQWSRNGILNVVLFFLQNGLRSTLRLIILVSFYVNSE